MPRKPRTEKDYAKMREHNNLIHMRVYRPEGKMPQELRAKIRLRCHEMGGDNHVANDVRLAVNSLWEEAEEFSIEWQWFHPEESVIVANRMSCNWKDSSEAFKRKYIARAQVECKQFEL